MEKVLRQYIKDFVRCKTCMSPETTLNKRDRLYFLKCDKCQSVVHSQLPFPLFSLVLPILPMKKSTVLHMVLFAAPLVTSPVIGTYISKLYGINVVVALSSSIALLDVVFIPIAVSESLAERVRSSATGWGQPIRYTDSNTTDNYFTFISVGTVSIHSAHLELL